MKHSLLITALSISLITASMTSSVLASTISENVDKNNLETGIGFGTGSIVGGLVAGPIGIVTGAFIGSLIGQNTANQSDIENLNNSNFQLKEKLSKNASEVNVQEDNNARQSLALNDAKNAIEILLTQNQELKNHALNFDIQFRTNSTDIEKQYQKYLSEFASAFNTVPNMEIEIAGFADRMGDEDSNLELSIKRAAQVRDYLIKQNTDEDRITTLAYGESQPLHLENNFENNFFDRRVTVYLRPIEISTENIINEIVALEKKLSIAEK